MRNNNVQLVTEVLDSLNNLSGNDTAAAELAGILREPHFKVIPKLSFRFHPDFKGFRAACRTARLTFLMIRAGHRGLWLIASGRRRAREVRQPRSLTHTHADTPQLGAGGALLLR